MKSIQQIQALYDSFEVKDMPFEEFALEFAVATRPPSNHELSNIELSKARRVSSGIRNNRIILN